VARGAAAPSVGPGAGRAAEPETVGVLGDAVGAESASHLIEEDVARLDDRPVEVHAAVAALLPAAEEVIAERDAARAGHAGERGHDALLERPGRDGDLEGRPGRELALHGAVVQRMLRVLHERAPLVAPAAAP